MIKNILQTRSNNVLVLLVLLTAFVCINLYSCNKPEQKAKPPEKLAETFLNLVQSGKSQEAVALYNDKMFLGISKDSWLNSLSLYYESNGSMKSYELQHTKQVKNVHKEYGGIYSYLVYKIEYDRKTNQEVFTIRQPGGGALELAGHYLNVDVVEPEKLIERILPKQSGKKASESPPATDKSIVQTLKIESDTKQEDILKKDSPPKPEQKSE